MSARARSSQHDRFILHITSREWWRAQQNAAEEGSGGFRDPSLDAEGFIHCSTVAQFLIPANEHFAGRDDLVLLIIDTELLPTKAVYEDCYETGTRFPHLYGPIPLSAVVEIVDFPPDAGGRFHEPEQLRSILASAVAESD